MKEELDKKDNSLAYKKYRLTLSVWLSDDEDEVELKTERRGAECVMPIGLSDATEKMESEAVDRLCEAIRGLYGCKAHYSDNIGMGSVTINWHFCEDDLPNEDGRYLTVLRFASQDVLSITPYIADTNGGWNCLRDDGEIINEYRIETVFAWADINELLEGLRAHENESKDYLTRKCCDDYKALGVKES